MTRRLALSSGATVAVLAACAGAPDAAVELAPPAATAKVATADLLGCMDGLTVHANWSPPRSEPYELELRAGEASAICRMEPPTRCGKVPPPFNESECTGTLRVHASPGRDESCTPTRAPSVDIASVPAKVTVIVRAEGTEIFRREVEPGYTWVEPNGQGVEPRCRIAQVEVPILPR